MNILKILTISILIAPGCVLAKDTVIWAIHDMPPAWIISGEYKGQGIVDAQRGAYQFELNNFKHEEIVVTQERLYALVKIQNNNETFCNAGQLVPEKLKPFVYMSKPVDKIMPNHIITTKENAKKMEIVNDEITLDNLLDNKNLVLAYVKSRPFGGTVNKVVDNKLNQTNILEFAYRMLPKLPALLDHRRIDYFFDYPFMIKYYKKANKIKSDFVSIRIKENNIFYNYNVICNRTPVGKDIISKINETLKNKKTNSRFNAGWKLWLPKYLEGKFRK